MQPQLETQNHPFNFFKKITVQKKDTWAMKIARGTFLFIGFQIFLTLFSLVHILTYSKMLDSSLELEKILQNQNYHDVYAISEHQLKEGSADDTKKIMRYLRDDIYSTQSHLTKEEQKNLYHLVKDYQYHNVDKLYETFKTEQAHCGPLGISSSVFASCLLLQNTNIEANYQQDKQAIDIQMNDIGNQIGESSSS